MGKQETPRAKVKLSLRTEEGIAVRDIEWGLEGDSALPPGTWDDPNPEEWWTDAKVGSFPPRRPGFSFTWDWAWRWTTSRMAKNQNNTCPITIETRKTRLFEHQTPILNVIQAHQVNYEGTNKSRDRNKKTGKTMTLFEANCNFIWFKKNPQ